MKHGWLRMMVVVLALALMALGGAACKSKKEREKAYAACKRGCVSKHLKGGTGGASVETGLRRTKEGGRCLTSCNNLRKPSWVQRKLGNIVD